MISFWDLKEEEMREFGKEISVTFRGILFQFLKVLNFAYQINPVKTQVFGAERNTEINLGNSCNFEHVTFIKL